VVVDQFGWRDPDQRATHFVRCSPGPLLEALADALEGGPAAPGGWQRAWLEAGEAAGRALAGQLAAAPLFEGQAVQALAAGLPAPAQVVVGSSMPIRDVDAFWPPAIEGQRFLANRGASGIDGVVSTGLGAAAAAPEIPTVLLLGDLSLCHDMNGLWAARRHGLRAAIIVLDNDGGGIFEFLPQAEHRDVFEELFGTPHGLRLEDVARLYGLGYASVPDSEALPAVLRQAMEADGVTLVHVPFRRSDSVAGHRACWAGAAASLRDSS
jgi:2-succinyl-5-enolpyruvyl-6-hydroxy-3-cyclohexene-1-carboxylate synthase